MKEPFRAETSPNEDEVEARMRPGAYSKTGFLGPGEKLRDVLGADAAALRELHLTCGELAGKLDELINAAENSPSQEVRLGDLSCRIQTHQGFQICPFAAGPPPAKCTAGKGVQYGSLDWWVMNQRNGIEMRGPGLIVHLIRDHGFFEGRRSPNRVDPATLAEVLGLGFAQQ